MISYKNLLLAAQKAETLLKQSTDFDVTELSAAIETSREFLVSTKTFEYDGELSMKWGNAIKLPGIKTDFDDVIRYISGKKNDIELNVYMCLVVVGAPIPTKEPEPTATVPTA